MCGILGFFIKAPMFSTRYLNEQFKTGTYLYILQNISNNAKISFCFSIHGIKKMLKVHKRNDQSNFLMRLLTLHLFLESNY